MMSMYDKPRNYLMIVGALLAVGVIVLLAVFFLPPFRLMDRLQGEDYTYLTAEEPLVSHQDGVAISAQSDELDGKFGVKLSSVPRAEFMVGSAGSELRRAAESLPSHLEVKSPYYKISTKGEAPGSTLVTIVIPNNAEPWDSLDLYTWTGDGWQWVGGRVDTDAETISADVGADVPDAVLVMQTGPIEPAISADLPAGETVNKGQATGVTHILPLGLLLGDFGGLAGDTALLPPAASAEGYALVPCLRNWSPETGNVNRGLLKDMLDDPGMRQAHIDNIADLIVGQGYAGVDLDYRGVTADLSQAYTSFVRELAATLHAQNKTLSVTVEEPSRLSQGGWSTGGYDWRALGMAADMLRVPLPADPDFYQDGGGLDAFMGWSLDQVSRYKFQPIFSALATDRVGDQVSFVSLEQALAPLGEVVGPEDNTAVPGEKVQLQLSGAEALATMQYNSQLQTYSYVYYDTEGQEHQVTLATTAGLRTRLNKILPYHLGGVGISGLFEAEDDPQLARVLNDFAVQAAAQASDVSDELLVIWTVEGAAGGQLARDKQGLEAAGFEWTAPEEGGDYVISAAIEGSTRFQRGSVALSVATPTPEPTATPVPTATLTPEGEGTTPQEVGPSDDCLDSTYVADVTVQDGTRFDNDEAFVKTWRVKNTGSCDWPEGTQLRFVEGAQMSGAEGVEVGPLAVGETTDISVDLVAPSEGNNYKGVWRLADGEGRLFGTVLTVVIQAGELPTPTPTPTPDPSQPTPPPAPLPAPAGGFELGGHLRTWSYVSQMQYSGMTWAKTQVHFGGDASGWINTAHANGFKIQLSALGTPNMVTQPGYEQEYANWVADLARAGADAIEVWNEPNIEREWLIGHISPQAYTNLLCTAYRAIKDANPNTIVISAAPAPTGYFGGCSPNGCDDLPWLQGMYNAGAANCMDYIGAHHNSGATSPSATSGHPADNGGGHHSWYFLPQTQLYYNVFGGARKLFYTEMGYASQEGVPPFSDMFAWARGTTNAQQAAWLAEAVQLSRSTGMVRCIIVWNIDFVRYGYDPQDGFAIIRPDGGCPACESLRGAMQ